MDPLGFVRRFALDTDVNAGDYDLYRYVFNNPTNATDPTGEAVVGVLVVSADTLVYNFTVADVHAYFVGDGQWLVHNTCYIRGGRTAMNLTPRPKDVDSGLSLSTAPQKGWKINATQQELQDLGFVVIPDPTPNDPGHFLLKPGTEFQNRGWTLSDWAGTRATITDDSSTWHALTEMLFNLAESYP